jgi:hypothetical protein
LFEKYILKILKTKIHKTNKTNKNKYFFVTAMGYDTDTMRLYMREYREKNIERCRELCRQSQARRRESQTPNANRQPRKQSGRKAKYSTQEERIENRNRQAREYYHRNKEAISEKRKKRYYDSRTYCSHPSNYLGTYAFINGILQRIK